MKAQQEKYGGVMKSFFSRNFTQIRQDEENEYKDGGLKVVEPKYENVFQIVGNEIFFTGELEVIDLVNLIPHFANPAITKFDFRGAKLDANNAGVILSLMSSRNNIDYLDFGANLMINYIQPREYSYFQEKKNSASKALALKNNEMFLKVVENNPIKYLGISNFVANNMFSFEKLIDVLSKKPGFKELDYSYNPLNSKETDCLIKLYGNKSFEKLDLSHALTGVNNVDKAFLTFVKYMLESKPQMSVDFTGTLNFCNAFKDQFKPEDQRHAKVHEEYILGHMFEDLYQSRTIARYALLPEEIGGVLADSVGKSENSYNNIGGIIADYYFNPVEFSPEVNILPAIEASGSCKEVIDAE